MTQRDLREPAYVYQFSPHFNELMTANRAYVAILASLKKTEIEQANLEDAQDRNHYLSSEQRRYFEREFERIRIDHSRYEKSKILLTDKINLLSSTLGKFYNDILDDLVGNYITQKQYLKFLSQFYQIIIANKSLPCFQVAPYPTIIEEIKINFKKIINQ